MDEETRGAILFDALCDRIEALEKLSNKQRKQIEDMDKCIKSIDDDRRKICADRDEWRRRALEAEENLAMGAAISKAKDKAKELMEEPIAWDRPPGELDDEDDL